MPVQLLLDMKRAQMSGTERVCWTRDVLNVAQKEAWQRHLFYVVSMKLLLKFDSYIKMETITNLEL